MKVSKGGEPTGDGSDSVCMTVSIGAGFNWSESRWKNVLSSSSSSNSVLCFVCCFVVYMSV